ncbi:MAG: LytR C-terminal domain-containing protein [Candidatus Krumholzibacteriia bacterium]
MTGRNAWLLAAVVLAAVSIWCGRKGLDRGAADAAAPVPAALSGVPATWREGTAPGAVDPAADAEEDALPIHLLVVNGTPEDGLAARTGAALTALGCVVDGVGDAPHPRYRRTLLINRRLPQRRAERLAARLGGVPLLCEWDARTDEDAVLVLGADHERVPGLAAAPLPGLR